MGRLINADALKYKMIKYGFRSIDMTVTEFVEDMLPTVEAIPKADYEARLKADMVAMLTEIQLEIEELDVSDVVPEYQDGAEETREYIADLLQRKIDALKGE